MLFRSPPVDFWDPLGLAAGGNASDFARCRGMELEHGRVAMLAAMGYIATMRRSGLLETYMARRRRGEQPRVPLASSAPSRPTPWRPSVPGPSRRR